MSKPEFNLPYDVIVDDEMKRMCRGFSKSVTELVEGLVKSVMLVEHKRMYLHTDWVARMMADTKKTVMYLKHEGTWSWCDRGCEESLPDHHTGFNTWLEAAEDSVEPYMDKENDEPD